MKRAKIQPAAAFDPSLSIQLLKKQPIAEELADRLRERILDGKLPPGTRLPTTQQLAAQWQTYVPAVHAALASLAKEGLLERLRCKGTFVRERESRLSRVGVMAPNKMWEDPERLPYVRKMFLVLEKYLLQQNVHTSIWYESRQGAKSSTPLAPLVKAVKKKEIQALITLNSGVHNAEWLNALPIPVTGLNNLLNNHVEFNRDSFFKLAAKALHQAGCRSAGLICVFPWNQSPIEAFHRAAKEQGIRTDDRWVHNDWDRNGKLDEYGYDRFRSFYSQSEKPDGLIVYPDTVAKGVMLGIAIMGVQVPKDLHVVFHKNAEIPFLCPVDAVFIDNSCFECAQALYEQLTRIHHGESCPCISLDYCLSEERKAQLGESLEFYDINMSA